MKKSKIFLVVLIALLMAVGVVLISCGGACHNKCSNDEDNWWVDCCPPSRYEYSYGKPYRVYGCNPCNCW